MPKYVVKFTVGRDAEVRYRQWSGTWPGRLVVIDVEAEDKSEAIYKAAKTDKYEEVFDGLLPEAVAVAELQEDRETRAKGVVLLAEKAGVI